ncbi:DUF4160 domain-containing protein [Nostoc sp.]
MHQLCFGYLSHLFSMPTLLTVGSYRFFCYTGDRDQPPHVHVERHKDEAKTWLEPYPPPK